MNLEYYGSLNHVKNSYGEDPGPIIITNCYIPDLMDLRPAIAMHATSLMTIKLVRPGDQSTKQWPYNTLFQLMVANACRCQLMLCLECGELPEFEVGFPQACLYRQHF